MQFLMTALSQTKVLSKFSFSDDDALDKNSVSLVISLKGESQIGGNKKANHVKFSEKRTFLPLGVLCFLVTSVLRFAIRPFALLWELILRERNVTKYVVKRSTLKAVIQEL